jgi:hypothetical protein
VPLIVTVHDTATDGSDCGICSDRLGDYVDGEDGVKAVIDQYGNLIIDFQTGRTQGRGLEFRKADGMTFATGTNQYMATITHSPTHSDDPDPTYVPLQQMVVGDPPQRVRSCPTYDDDVTGRRYVHSFQRDCYVANSAADDSSFLWVTVVANLTEWTVESTGSHEATVFDVPTKGRIQGFHPGDRPLPFRMTLRAK